MGLFVIFNYFNYLIIKNYFYSFIKFISKFNNYYLNAPMRSDKTEDWRFPPLYYVKPKYK